MRYISRLITTAMLKALERGKSVLLLGARQTGKTTCIQQEIKPDWTISFLLAEERLRYEKDPTLLVKECRFITSSQRHMPLIFIDEVQKVPGILDSVQWLIDQGKAQFIITGSAVRKLKYGVNLNYLPGRVVLLLMDPLCASAELDKEWLLGDGALESLLLEGSLPGIWGQGEQSDRQEDLHSYVMTYLEQEIRAESMVRDVGHFARFLELAASEAGSIVNKAKLSQEIGVAASTIAEYYQILEECMIAYRIDPIIESVSKRRLIRSPKYLFFDMGIRRLCAHEGMSLPLLHISRLFEQYVGIELLRLVHIFFHRSSISLKYWRDSAGLEVDYVIEKDGIYCPVEVKWTDSPRHKDASNMLKFLKDYPDKTKKEGIVGYIICRTPRPFEVVPGVLALPWQDLAQLMCASD